jgi:hypothetical protein
MTTTVQTAATVIDTTYRTSRSLSFSSARGVGNLLYATVAYKRDDTGGSVAPPTPPAGWTGVGLVQGSAFVGLQVYWRIADNTAADQFTATFAVECRSEITLVEKAASSGKVWAASGLVNATASGSQSANTLTGTGSLTTSVADTYLVAVLATEEHSSNTIAVDNGFGVRVKNAEAGTLASRRVAVTAGRTQTTAGTFAAEFEYAPNGKVSLGGMVAFAMEPESVEATGVRRFRRAGAWVSSTARAVRRSGAWTSSDGDPSPATNYFLHTHPDDGRIPHGTSWQQQNSSLVAGGLQVEISTGDRWGSGANTRFHSVGGEPNLGIAQRDEMYCTWPFTMPANSSLSTVDNGQGDTKVGYGLGGIADSLAPGDLADGENKMGAGNTWSLRLQFRADNSGTWYGESTGSGPFVEAYAYAYHAAGRLWSANTRTANFGIHELLKQPGGATWNPQAGIQYKVTLFVKRNTAGQNNGIIRVYIDDVLMLEWTDVRLTQADTVPVNVLSEQTFTNGLANGELWLFPSVRLHAAL